MKDNFDLYNWKQGKTSLMTVRVNLIYMNGIKKDI